MTADKWTLLIVLALLLSGYCYTMIELWGDEQDGRGTDRDRNRNKERD
ncbi:MAG TPA: hypothetical protein PLS95_01145 [Thermoanaerobaculales bacterium]|nr:hypothetical protein [Thermoanaerobaculales bacterium]